MATVVSRMAGLDSIQMSDYAVKIQISSRTFGCPCCGLNFAKPNTKSEVPLITESYRKGMKFVGECFSKHQGER